jgi:tetraacyldisaccharide 4'-kinase
VLGVPLAWVYGRCVASRNRAWDAGRGVVTLDRPVISIGNLSVGGTGKTPMVVRTARMLAERGRAPCVAMRGYGRGGWRGERSDEARDYRELLPGVPVVVGPDRVERLLEHFAQNQSTDCVVLDDGFQHRRLARQLDVVLIDATRDPFADRLLPAGRLREPVESMARAQLVVLTHAEAVSASVVEELGGRVRGVAPGAHVAVAEHAWTGVRVGAGGGESRQEVAWLRGKRALVVCGIGNPEAFVLAARRSAEVVAEMVLPDHEAYSERRVWGLLSEAERARAEVVLTTSKDWTKLRMVRADAWPCAVARPELSLEIVRGGEAFDAMIARAATLADADDGA